MTTYSDALRDYAFEVLKRDGFRCRYCGLDGTASFANWLALSWDHLLPKSHANRDNPEYIVAACSFCNWSDNRYFEQASARGLRLEGLAPDVLVRQRLPFIERSRTAYREFWEGHVARAKAMPSGQ